MGKTEAETSTAKALEDKLVQETHTQMATQINLSQDTQTKKAVEALLRNQGVNEAVKKQILEQDVGVAVAAAKKANNEGEIDDTTYGKIMRYIDRAVNAITPFKGGFKK